MFKKITGFLVITLSVLISGQVFAAKTAEVNVCYAEQGNDNVTYMNMATTKTRFICFGTDKSIRPTFNQLYGNGWRLIQIVEGKQLKNNKGVQNRVTLYYFERFEKPKKARF